MDQRAAAFAGTTACQGSQRTGVGTLPRRSLGTLNSKAEGQRQFFTRLALTHVSFLELMSVKEIIAELPKLSDQEREMVLEKLVNLDARFEPTSAMSEAIREGLKSLNEEKSYSTAELRSRIAGWTAR